MKRFIIISLVIILCISFSLTCFAWVPEGYTMPTGIINPTIVIQNKKVKFEIYLSDGVSLYKNLDVSLVAYSSAYIPGPNSSLNNHEVGNSTLVYSMFISRYITAAGLTWDLKDLNTNVVTDYKAPSNYDWTLSYDDDLYYNDVIGNVPSGTYTSRIYFGDYAYRDQSYIDGWYYPAKMRFIICDSTMDDLPENVKSDPSSFYRIDFAINLPKLFVPAGNFQRDFIDSNPDGGAFSDPWIDTLSPENVNRWGAFGLMHVGNSAYMWNIVESWNSPVWKYYNTGYSSFYENGGNVEYKFTVELPTTLTPEAIAADKTLDYLSNAPADQQEQTDQTQENLNNSSSSLQDITIDLNDTPKPEYNDFEDILDNTHNIVNYFFSGNTNNIFQTIFAYPYISNMLYLFFSFGVISLILFGKKG